jgi:hypothetical protein
MSIVGAQHMAAPTERSQIVQIIGTAPPRDLVIDMGGSLSLSGAASRTSVAVSGKYDSPRFGPHFFWLATHAHSEFLVMPCRAAPCRALARRSWPRRAA